MSTPRYGRATPNTTGRANRIAPDGTNHAVAARGLVWGNRGRLLDDRGELVRHANGRNWLCCVLEFHDRRRTQWRPNRLTELYFLDEPTALAAGHRPCGECRHHDYQRFKAAWSAAHPDLPSDARSIDRHLHADRLDGGRPRTYRDDPSALPDGVVVEHAARFWLLRGDSAHAWTFDGYVDRLRRSELPAIVVVRTPRASVATLAAGYEPRFYHPTSDGLLTVSAGSRPAAPTR